LLIKTDLKLKIL